MKQFVEETFQAQVVLGNLKKTTLYFLDALSQRDYESANLELEELQFLMNSLKEFKLKRERRAMLVKLVKDMKQRGINIDFAGCSSLFQKGAKIAGESNKKISDIHKKRQQA
ncbi:MAG: hypothetical protein Q8934_15500 [Bacillota bacterium]|nr:hypothetical protein [Bacillota bacterium]